MGLRVGRRRCSRRGIVAAIFAITIHAAILGVFLVTTPRFWSTARERRPMSLEIVEPSGIFEPLVSSSRARGNRAGGWWI